jgi:hypothetical protein
MLQHGCRPWSLFALRAPLRRLSAAGTGVSPLNMVFIHQQTIITTEKRDITA